MSDPLAISVLASARLTRAAMVTCAACVLWLAVGLSACTPSGGDDWRNGITEEHIDPGPGEIASTLARDYVAAGGGDALRGVRVWPDDGLWVYTERTAAGQPPERAVYRIDYGDPDGNVIEDYVAHAYAVPSGAPPLSNEPGAAGPLAGLAPGDLTERPGCAVVFERTGPGDYAGATVGAACPPRDAAASHSVTEITIADGLSVWTRDVDASGAHAAGPAAPTLYQPTDGSVR